jgi:HlyD family secretion protein
VFIRANYSANADVVLDEKKQVLAIREALVQYDPVTAQGSGSAKAKGKPFVEVETDKAQVFARREVELGLSDGINVEVTKGVTAKDKIKVPDNAGPPEMPGSGGGRGGKR